MTDAAAIGGGRIFCLMSMAVVQCGSSRTTHMYMHQRFTRGIRHEGGRERVLFLVLFLRFRLQFLLRMGAEQLHQTAGTGRRWHDTLGRPRNSFWWLVILIFLVLCQTARASYLCDQPTKQREQLGFFSWSWFGLLTDGTAGMMMMMARAATTAAVVASGIGRVLYRFKQSSFRNRHPWQRQCCHVLTSGACPVGWWYADQLRFFQRDAFVLFRLLCSGNRITAQNRYTPAIDTSAQF